MLEKDLDFICICCPRGCHLHVTKDLKVSGNFCPRGAKYGLQEATSPERVLTSTVAIKGARLPLCPVKSLRPIPKGKIFEAMKEVDAVSIEAPVSEGDVIIPSLAGTGIPLVSTLALAKE